MKHHFKVRRRFLLIVMVSFCSIIILGCFFLTGFKLEEKDNEPIYGANLSRIQAQEYGLDYGELYLAVLDDLKVKKLRLPSYWSQIAATEGEYHWGDLDWELQEASKRGVEVILVVGKRQPRWPECHLPGWAEELSEEELNSETLKFVEATVERYKYHDAIKIWQVENEPLLNIFGECPYRGTTEVLEEEVELVKRLDPSRPVLVTESGELSSWQRSTKHSDILGISVYRLVWNKYLGFLRWPITPGHYGRKYDLVSWKSDDFIVTELQTEPWAPESVLNLSIYDQLGQIDAQELSERAEFTRLTGASEIYFWGIEWFYWLKTTHDNDSLWEEARQYF